VLNLNAISLKKIKKASNIKGNINKILSINDPEYKGFGEIYTSIVKKDSVKAWKYHKKMTLNLTVIYGETKFVFFDGNRDFKSFNISSNDPHLLTVPPKLWYGFKSLNNNDSLVLNFTNFIFNENEIERKNQDEIEFPW
tara:strand:- start:131 stop:547 length:417 start_codon:yes stop_codon:yes gene_type:complete